MSFTIHKHIGLRTTMEHVYQGGWPEFTSFRDAQAWLHLQHDNLNWSFICHNKKEVLYGISPTSEEGYYTDTFKALLEIEPWHIFDRQYYLQKVKHG